MREKAATAHWVGVASRDHVLIARDGGFCQLSHGKESPLQHLNPGDTIAYYSPRETIRSGDPVQAFTALGEVQDGDIWQAEAGDFRPFRRAVRYLDVREAPIRPLLDRLSFTRGRPAWGQTLRRGTFRIEAEDHALIAQAMGVEAGPLG